MSAQFPEPETVRAALTMATQAPSVHNSQPWHWHVGGRGIDGDPAQVGKVLYQPEAAGHYHL